ncbi:GNAT family N-acetyltransferase [Anaerococcus sp. Marseille-P3915]|uniref:GNAT family N-acetyltransferase n=1 Tax=Anaerococcus sp. Marseille-P3915 TaxID=2057799 RepID=UPI000D0AF8A7|nr:GNAT family N-acetyltransferase [Anaerococcus sp. Marseille-P3915]
MEFNVKEIKDKKEKEEIVRDILNDLPEWFGLAESTEAYIRDSQDKPFLAAFYEGNPVGFIVLNATSQDSSEIFVMGIKKAFHRQGAGRVLNEKYEILAKSLGNLYSQVKTVQSGHYEEYDITNNFYKAIGYKELEVFPTLWDEWNPCQIYIKYLGD